jgi:RimJ/RimL family protein N-acetyltransferase
MIIEHDDVRLRPFGQGDLTRIVNGLGDWAVSQWVATPPFPYRADHAQAWIDLVAQDHAGRWPGRFAVADRESDRLLGSITVGDRLGHHPELGYWFLRAAWGRGIGTRATRAILAYAFDQLDHAVVIARTAPGNRQSSRILIKTGFRRCGQHRLPAPNRRGADYLLDYVLSREAWYRND